MVVLRIYGARAIFLLFYDDQDAELESNEMEIGLSGSISIQKNISISMEQFYPQSTTWDQNIVAIIHIYGDRAIYILWSPRSWIWVTSK